MALKYPDNARHLVTTTGTGNITLGTVPDGWQSFSAAGVQDGDLVPYYLSEGSNWELGHLLIDDGVTTGQRIVKSSSNGGSPIDLQGAAVITAVALGRDLMPWVVQLTDGATVDLDASLGSVFVLIAEGDRVIQVPEHPTPGKKIIIRHRAVDADRTLSLASGAGGFRFGTDIPELTPTAEDTIDYIGAIYDATDDRWDVVAYAKGYEVPA